MNKRSVSRRRFLRKAAAGAGATAAIVSAGQSGSLGQAALQAQGYHQDAIIAFRKARQYDPNDRSLDASIDRSQKGIVAEFLNRYRR